MTLDRRGLESRPARMKFASQAWCYVFRRFGGRPDLIGLSQDTLTQLVSLEKNVDEEHIAFVNGDSTMNEFLKRLLTWEWKLREAIRTGGK